MLAGDEELRLDLLALARCELQPEVRQPGVPGARQSVLQRGVLGRLTGHRMPLLRSADGAEPAVRRGPRRGRVDPALDEGEVEHRPAEPGEQAHAVAGPEDAVEVLECLHRQVVVDHLLDVVRRPGPQRDRGDDAEPAEPDGGVGRHGHQLAAGRHQLILGDRRGQARVAVAGAVGAGGAGARDRDVRQRAEVVQRPAGPVERPDQLAEPRPGADRHGVAGDLQPGRQILQADQVPAGVGHPAERVPGAQRPDPVGVGDHPAQLVHRPRPQHPPRPELDIPTPVPPGHDGILPWSAPPVSGSGGGGGCW